MRVDDTLRLFEDEDERYVREQLSQTLDEKIEQTNRLVAENVIEWNPARTVAMLSGGNDSTTMLYATKWSLTDPPNGVLHINTGIGIHDTRAFVRDTTSAWSLQLFEATPPPLRSPLEASARAKTDRGRQKLLDLDRRVKAAGLDWGVLTPYEQFVLRFGFPGPGGHQLVYVNLKQRALERFLREQRIKRGERTLLLSGVRYVESERRMGTGKVFEKKGGQLWLNPFFWWTSDDLDAYRDRHPVPHNEVSDHLHMSGECLCGAFAKPGELEGIRFFFPEVAAYIEQVQRLATAVGQPHCKWGMRPGKSNGWAGPMCHDCDVLQKAREAAGL